MLSLTFYRINSWLLIIVLIVVLASCDKGNNEKVIPPVIPPVTNPGGTTKSDVQFWLTNPDQMIYLKKQSIALNFSSSSNYNPSIVVDTTQTFQTMDGFGFALTGGSAYLINSLPSADKVSLLNELFTSDSTFIGINYLRVSIGASDLDAKVFSYDDMPANQTDLQLQNFSIEPDKVNLISILKSIVALNPGIKILGSPWSAPVWMKSNQSAVGGSLKPENYSVYALSLIHI